MTSDKPALPCLTHAEAALFTALRYGPDRLSNLPATAVREYDRQHLAEEECRAALEACLAKGWVQVIDEAALGSITEELRKGAFIGPIYGLPQVGEVDFTPLGADILLQYRPARPSRRAPSGFTDVVHSKIAYYFKTRAAALERIELENKTAYYFKTRAAALERMELEKQWTPHTTATGPVPMGAWRARWWRRFPHGYHVDIEQRWQWCGTCGRGEGCYVPSPRARCDPLRLQHVLDRHNVALSEWLVLAAMDLAPCSVATLLPRQAARWADKHFGLTASEDICRTGLESCLSHGWLMIVDRHALDVIQALLHDEPALMPLELDGGEIDFAPGGAALYRMLAAEAFGQEWEDDLEVWKAYYREEHRYCETTDDVAGLLQEYADFGEIVRTSKVVPLGPWCVRWWERFPSGFRLEVEIGERRLWQQDSET